ncbi:MAG: circadian clock protein KaiC [Actinobacteria bacterium]|nr:MAG: circadian clock protein KaiC [Actinomycetota bacterium]
MTTTPTPGAGLTRVPVGIAGFDDLSMGGLSERRTTVVVGTAGSGKTVFAVQFLIEGIRQFGQPGVLATFEETPQDIAANVAGFGWDLQALGRDGRLAVVDGSQAATEEVITIGDFDFEGLIARIESAVRKVNAKRVAVDALGALLPLMTDPTMVRRELRRVIAAFREMGVTTLLTLERREEYGPVARFEVEDFVADNVIVLRNPLHGEKRRRTIEILKLSGCPHHKGEYPFTIEPRTGVNIIPLSAVELSKEAPSERLTLGSPELDAMCGGGLHRDSLVLVSGGTGTGKTLMATHFAHAAITRGEPALYVSLEESSGQLIRTARSWGMDLEPSVGDGRLTILAQYPERMGLEDLLVQLRLEIERLRPTRIVIDSLTALERNATVKSFREFVVGLVSTLKSSETAGMFTHTAPVVAPLESVTETHISTIADAIMLLRYVEIEGNVRRAALLLKMRGSWHDTQIHEYHIDDTGMRMGEPLRGMSGILGGTQLYSTYTGASAQPPVPPVRRPADPDG